MEVPDDGRLFPEAQQIHARAWFLGERMDLRALERKLDLIARTAQTYLGLLQNRQSLRVEWSIVLPILVEIVLILYDLFRKI